MTTSKRTPSPEEFAEADELRQINRRLEVKLIRQKTKTDELVNAVYSAAHDAMVSAGPISPIAFPKIDHRKAKTNEVALWHLTDWQGAKLTRTYNSQVMRTRLHEFCRKAELITNIQRADHPVKEAIIAFGGDMVEGLFNFPTQPFEIDQTIFDQYISVSRLIVEVVRHALAGYEHVTVVAEWGNHGRIGSKRAAVPRSDNFDRMCYELARQLLENETRLTWIENSAEDIQHIQVGNYRALLIHGDEVGRNGFASKTTIRQHVNNWKAGAHKDATGKPWDFRDCYVGHYHTHEELSLANGEGSVFWTGSTESDNRYAADGMASSALPSQRLHFIDPKEGRVTAIYKIWLP